MNLNHREGNEDVPPFDGLEMQPDSTQITPAYPGKHIGMYADGYMGPILKNYDGTNLMDYGKVNIKISNEDIDMHQATIMRASPISSP